jgi:hypothetical protein
VTALPDRAGDPTGRRAVSSRPPSSDRTVRVLLVASLTAVLLGLIGAALAAIRVGFLLLVAGGEELLAPASGVLLGLGVGGVLLALAARSRQVLPAALGVGALGIAAGVAARAVALLAFRGGSSARYVAYTEGSLGAFAWPITASVVLGPVLAVAGAALVLVAVVAMITLLVRRIGRGSALG